MSVYIICLSIDSIFDANIKRNAPLITTVHTQFPSRFHNFNIIFLRASLKAKQNETFILAKNDKFHNDKFHPNLANFTPNDPLFREVDTQKGQFFIPHLMTTYPLRNPTLNVPCFVLR